MATPQYFTSSTRDMISDVRTRYPHLTRERENALWKAWNLEGNTRAKDSLVLGHIDLMVKMVNRVLGYGIPADDLLGQAMQGMQRALKGYDPSRGFRLGTFARAWIKESMMTYIQANTKIIQGPSSAASKMMFYHLGRLRTEMNIQGAVTEQDAMMIRENLMLRLPSAKNLTVRAIMDSDYYMSSTVSTANASADGEDTTRSMFDSIASDEEPVDELLAEQDETDQRSGMFRKALKILNPRQLDIVTQRRLIEPGKTLQELSEKYNVSRERIRQIEAHALRKIKVLMNEMVTGRDMVARAIVLTRQQEVATTLKNRLGWTGIKPLKGVNNSVKLLVRNARSKGKIVISDEELALRRSLSTLKGNMSRTPEQRSLISKKGAETLRKKRADAAANGVLVPLAAGSYTKMGLSQEEVNRRRSMSSRRANMSRTPEQRRLITIKGNMSRTPEQRRQISIKAAETVRLRKQMALAH